jgi:hypothetical protein
MSLINVTPLVDGVITAAQINNIISAFVTDYNGGITDANISRNADIDGLKIQDATITSRKFKPIIGKAYATANTNLSTSYQDLTGVSVTFTCDIASTVLVTGVFDFSGIVVGSNVAYGRLMVDGVAQTGVTAIDSNSGTLRATIFQNWSIDVEPGVHVFKLQGKTTTDTGSETCMSGHTSITYYVISR